MSVEWAGVPFLAIGHRDGRFIRAPGLWGFARREHSGEFTLLFLDHADAINEAAGPGHPRWSDAMTLGMNEVHVCLKAKSRIDRLQLRAHILRRAQPLLNVLEWAPRAEEGGGEGEGRAVAGLATDLTSRPTRLSRRVAV